MTVTDSHQKAVQQGVAEVPSGLTSPSSVELRFAPRWNSPRWSYPRRENLSRREKLNFFPGEAGNEFVIAGDCRFSNRGIAKSPRLTQCWDVDRLLRHGGVCPSPNSSPRAQSDPNPVRTQWEIWLWMAGALGR
jgi:hypothetical protein